MAENTTPVDEHVAKTLTSLANLIDERITVRGVRGGLPRAARHLGVATDRVVTARLEPSPLTFVLVCRALGREIAKHPNAQVRSNDEDAPQWSRFDLAGTSELIPGELVVDFPAGAVADVALVVEVGEDFGEDFVQVSSRREDAAVAQAYLDRLVGRARGEDNPYRGRALTATTLRNGLGLKVVERPTDRRDHLILSEDVWGAIDVNVHGLFAHHDLLTRAGLRPNRGVLLAGPPGTGKTAVTRVVAAEVGTTVTVVFADAQMLTRLDALYDEVAHLAPALVVLEDIDLVVRNRHLGGAPDVLQRFLVALDGMMSRHRGVVTIATTNDPDGIDPAARRACRFDVIVGVGLPDAEARRTIFETYLGPLGVEGDVAHLVPLTDGMSGAEIQELVRTAILVAGGVPTVADLVAVAAARDHESVGVGLYL